MRAPAFWETGEGPWPHVLAPLSLVTGLAGMARRALVRSATLPVPVVCIGNLVAGGAGKTPVVSALLPVLRGLFREDAGAVQILSRSEEHTSELQSLMRISYAVFCLKKKQATAARVYQAHRCANI